MSAERCGQLLEAQSSKVNEWFNLLNNAVRLPLVKEVVMEKTKQKFTKYALDYLLRVLYGFYFWRREVAASPENFPRRNDVFWSFPFLHGSHDISCHLWDHQ